MVEDFQQKHIDFNIEAAVDGAEVYTGTRSMDTKMFPVVGVRDEDADDYHLYITNLPRKQFLPSDLATIYRCRWKVELLFRELKTQYELGEFDTSKLHVVEILLYAALLSLLVNRDLLDLVTEKRTRRSSFTEMLGDDFPVACSVILHELGEYLGYSLSLLLEQLIEAAQKCDGAMQRYICTWVVEPANHWFKTGRRRSSGQPRQHISRLIRVRDESNPGA